MSLHPADMAIIAIYLLTIVGTGVYLSRRASGSIENYFLGGRRLHWLFISISGSVSTFDITGTMWICSMFYIMGIKSLWIHGSWGFLMAAFYMTYMGKWVRRSNVMTGAEWMRTRFGDGLDGRLARQVSAVTTVISIVAMIGYAFQGVGKFFSVYLPFSQTECALLVIGITSVYVILGGYYSVIFTDLFQTVVLTIAAIFVAVVCYTKISYETLSQTLPAGWFELLPSWRPDYLQDTRFELFGVLTFAWMLKCFLLNAGGPDPYSFQRFLSTRSSRDACKVGAAWCFFLVSRWGMCMGITALALIGTEGITDTEKVLPHVLNTYLPIGLKGLILAGFIAAFMSTFDTTINAGASFIVKDIYQGWIRPKAGARELTAAAYLSSILIVVCGILVGVSVKSIESIWTWITMVLTSIFLVPSLFRWFWWRFNGWGMVGSLVAGLIACITLTTAYPTAPVYVSLYILVGISTAAAVTVTLLTPATDWEILTNFYTSVRPGGFWKPVREKVGIAETKTVQPEFLRDIFNTAIACITVICMYLAPIYAVIHMWAMAGLYAFIGLITAAILAKTWYPYLPKD